MSEIEIKVPNIGDFKDVEVIEVLVSEGQNLKKNDQSKLNSSFNKKNIEIVLKNKNILDYYSKNIKAEPQKTINYEFSIIRVIGNDLPPLHVSNQSLNNIEYIIKNEDLHPKAIRIWILNRIVYEKKLVEIKKLLDSNKEIYYEIPYNPDEFLKSALINFEHSSSVFNVPEDFQNLPKGRRIKLLNKILLNFNKYLMNNNGARNYALKVGKEMGSKWTLVFDGIIFQHNTVVMSCFFRFCSRSCFI